MNENYLKNSYKKSTNNFNDRYIDKYKSQIYKASDGNNNEINYNKPLSPGINIFSELCLERIFNSKNPREIEMGNFLKFFREQLIEISYRYNDNIYLPKLSIREDSHSIVIEWNYNCFRIYFSFEDNPEYNSYGIVFNDFESGNFSANSGKLIPEKYALISSQMIKYVMENI